MLSYSNISHQSGFSSVVTLCEMIQNVGFTVYLITTNGSFVVRNKHFILRNKTRITEIRIRNSLYDSGNRTNHESLPDIVKYAGPL